MAQSRGVDVHEQLEAYLLRGAKPTHPLADAFVQFAPSPGHAEVEVPVSFVTPSSPWLGFVDVAYDWQLDSEPVWATTGRERIPRLQVSGRSAPLASTGVTVVGDWKSTKKIGYAKRAEELVNDAAAVLYAWDAFQGGAKRVFGRWVYGEWDDETKTGGDVVKQVWFEFKLVDVTERIIALDALAAEMQYHWANKTPAVEMACNTSVCLRYKKRDPKPGQPSGACWYLEADYCTPVSTFKMPTGESQ